MWYLYKCKTTSEVFPGKAAPCVAKCHTKGCDCTPEFIGGDFEALRMEGYNICDLGSD